MKAYEVIETHGWTRGYAAVDANNKRVDPRDPAACKFCILGALTRAYQTSVELEQLKKLGTHLAGKPFEELNWYGVGDVVAQWNDAEGRTKEEVVSLLKELDV